MLTLLSPSVDAGVVGELSIGAASGTLLHVMVESARTDKGDSESDGSDSADSAENLLASCLRRPPDEQDEAVEAMCRERPELAEALRASYRALRGLGLAGDGGLVAWPERVGDFRLGERIGGGGMGVVFRARQLSLGRDVAVKLLRPDQLQFASARERFRREAAAIAALDHPGIVPVIATGEERGVPWFAMPLLTGLTLAEVLAALADRRGQRLGGADLARVLAADPRSAPLFELSWNDACLHIARDVALALEHAHSRGVRHRDVKPSNIVLGADGRARLLDFGLAARDQVDGLTRTGSQLGTLYYMAPEQVRGERSVGALADVYALGVTLHECLARRPVFAGETRRAIEERILHGQRNPLRAEVFGVDRDLEHVIAMACELEPAKRYASAAAFAEDLRRLLERRPVAARRPSLALRLRRWAQREPTLAIASASAVLVFGVAPSVLLWREKRHGAVLAESLANEERASTSLRESLAREQAALGERSAALEREREARQSADLALEEARLTVQLMDEMLVEANPQRARGKPVLLVDVLEPAAAKLRTDQAPPRAAARLLATIASTQDMFGAHEAALANYRRAAELEQREGKVLGSYAGQMRGGMATALSNLGRLEEAEQEGRAAVAEHERHCDVAEDQACSREAVLRTAIGVALLRQGRFEEAADELQLAFGAQSQLLPEDPTGWGLAGVFLCDALRELARRKPGPDNLRRWSDHVRALAERRLTALDADDPVNFQIAHQGARLMSSMNRHSEADELIAEALEGARRVFGDDNWWVAFYEEEHGGMAYRARDWERAEAAFKRALELRRTQGGPGSAEVQRCEAMLAELARRRAAAESGGQQ
mgnify:CR=1 FL=1